MDPLALINYALTKLGHRVITSLDGQEKEAILAKQLYPIVRREILAMYPWKVAAKNVTLQGDVYEDVWQFQLPSDWLRTISISDSGHITQQGNTLIAPNKTLQLWYVSADTDEHLWPSALCELYASRLAMQMAESLTQSGAKYGQMMRSVERARGAVSASLLVRITPSMFEEDTWYQSRIQ